MNRFRFQFLSSIRSLSISCPRVRFQLILSNNCSLICRFYFTNKTFVSAEPETSELSSDHSPAKIYTPLQTSSPKKITDTVAQGTPVTPVLQIDESAVVDSRTVPPHSSVAEPVGSQNPGGDKVPSTSKTNLEANTTPLKAMEETSADINQEMYEEYVAPEAIQALSAQYNQIISQSLNDELDQFSADAVAPNVPPESELMEIQLSEHAGSGHAEIPTITSSSINVTRRELVLLNNFLGRIPPEFVENEEIEADQPFTLMVVNEPETPTMLLTSSQEDVGGPSSSYSVSQAVTEDRPGGKRRRPKYSLTTAMLKKHPVMKFSATGPIDKDKNPHKWWCRVCKVELSLMSRGSLELLSHYKSESHLIKEHRIRMEIPGMALYDKDGVEILGIPLSEAKKKATDTYPIVPQRDGCRPLIGQDSVPNFGSNISPTDKILSQISVLEYGLRHGGHIKSLTGIYDELSQLSSETHFCVQNWSPHRLFVSIINLLVNFYSNIDCFILLTFERFENMYVPSTGLYIGFHIVPFDLQGILVHMFRELIGYCTTAITSSGYYSLAVQHSTTMSYVNIVFWSGNVLHHVCLGSAPRGMFLPRKILTLISSFISLFETPPTCVSLINFDEKMSHCLSNCLPGNHQPSIVQTYGPEEFEKSLGLPTAQVIERHDYRTILDFLLMKLRTALDKDWLKRLPILYKVTCILIWNTKPTKICPVNPFDFIECGPT